MKLMILYEKEIRKAITQDEALKAIEQAFSDYAQGKAVVPGIISLNIPESKGEVHLKGGSYQGL